VTVCEAADLLCVINGQNVDGWMKRCDKCVCVWKGRDRRASVCYCVKG
jgi:hypothetical protein